MISRRFDLSLAALALTTALCAPAAAQYYSPPPAYRDGPSPRGLAQEPAEEGALPPPGFAVPPGQRMPTVSGHQLDAPGAGPDQQGIIRPPAAIGQNPNAAPVAAPQPGAQPMLAALPPEDQPEIGTPKELPPHLKKQLVDYPGKEPAGTIVIDTPSTFLYLTLGNGKAIRYGIGVGRDGFTWAGAEKVSKMAEWPDWHPPAEMIERQPYLPRFMAGGNGNPLGARALYLGKTLYRIHGTNQPSTIGSFVSSGCIRLLNEDVEDLYSRVQVGTRVVVLPGEKPATTAANATGPAVAPVQGLAPPQNAPAQGRPQGLPPQTAPSQGMAQGAPADLTAPGTAPSVTSQPLAPLPPPPSRTR